MKLILIGVILITLFTNTTMAKNKKNINWRQIMTSDEAYTYTPNPVKSFMTEWGKSGKNLSTFGKERWHKNIYKKLGKKIK